MAGPAALSASYHPTLRYRPLSVARNEIRLLIIEPSAAPDSRIQCRLEHVSLFDLENDFVALSYYWGDHNSIKDIMLSGDLIPITVNLYTALGELRRRGLYRIWADSLCINQHDDEERSQQILRMGAIYQSASLVFTHLRGPDFACQQLLSATVKRAIEHAEAQKQAQKAQRQDQKEAKRLARERNQWLENRSTIQRILHPSSKYPETPTPTVKEPPAIELSATEEKVIFQFLDNPYWLRAWIIQEISMNPQLMIVWGRQLFDFSQLIQAFSHMSTSISSKMRQKVWDHMIRLYEVRTSKLALKPMSLIEVLGLCHLAQSKFVQDRVFALLGLTHDGASLVPAPSYTLSEDDISRDMTVRMIRGTGNLDIIVFQRHRFKTWYPDWFDSWYWHLYRYSKLRLGKPSLLTYTNYSPYCSSGKHTSSLKVDGKSIIVKGFFLGGVAGCSPTRHEAIASNVPRTYLLKPRHWKPIPENENSDHQDPFITLCFLLINITKGEMDARLSGGIIGRLLDGNVQKVLKHAPSLLPWLNCCEKQLFEIDGQPFATYFVMTNGNKPRPNIIERASSTIEWNLKANMRLGYTSEAHIGWFSCNTKVGDQVAILLGSSMPCVLRQRPSGGYSIVGECIIDGVMKGEAVKKGLQGLQDIQLY
ncbi:heterokaryon incompatibility protein-domain-containing protein [Xylariaceae sp. AK1471]|nr:heterokaryon incompatibility protein-domain-containing protein [Xylariaceae sp. AK1471]